MISPKTLACSFAINVLAIALPGCAANAPPQFAGANAACEQARIDLDFLQRMATTEGNSNQYSNAPMPPACSRTYVSVPSRVSDEH